MYVPSPACRCGPDVMVKAMRATRVIDQGHCLGFARESLSLLACASFDSVDQRHPEMGNRAQKIFNPEFRFGLGGVPLGNEFSKHTDKEAQATLETAWALGVRYYDVAPWYGLGLADRRFGH